MIESGKRAWRRDVIVGFTSSTLPRALMTASARASCVGHQATCSSQDRQCLVDVAASRKEFQRKAVRAQLGFEECARVAERGEQHQGRARRREMVAEAGR